MANQHHCIDFYKYNYSLYKKFISIPGFQLPIRRVQTKLMGSRDARLGGCYIKRIMQSDELKPFKAGIAGVLGVIGAGGQPMTMPINWHSAV